MESTHALIFRLAPPPPLVSRLFINNCFLEMEMYPPQPAAATVDGSGGFDTTAFIAVTIPDLVSETTAF
ncbi:hypothetical protein U1Q18_017563, partial [Sarracenia purpurea var. burkii]